MELSRRDLIKILGVAGAASLVTSCTIGGGDLDKPVGNVQGGDLIIGLNSDVASLDPHRALGWTTMLVTLTMGEHLVTEDLTATKAGPPPLIPLLAKDYKISDDGLEYVFNLRDDVLFHDGTPFDAAAAEFNIRRQWDKSFEYFFDVAAGTSFWDYQFVKSVKAADSHTLNLTLTQPWPEFLRMNAQSWGQQFMISPTYIKKVGNDKVGDGPVLTGPYKFKERVTGERIVVERNPDYWGTAPIMDSITFVPLPDVPTRVTALTSGTIDIAQDPLPWSSKGQIEATANVTTANSPYLLFMSLNLKDEIMKIKEVRQAVEFGIDKENLVNTLYGDWGVAAKSMLPMNSPSYDPNFKGREYDPDKAKQLLAGVGYGDGFQTHMLINETYADVAQIIQRDLAKVGIDIIIDKVDFPTFGAAWGSGLVSPQTMTFAGWGMTADYWIDVMSRSTRQPPNGTNIAWYSNPNVDALLDQAQVSNDQATRTGLYQQVGAALFDDLPHIPLMNFGQPTASGKNVQGLVRPNEAWFSPNIMSFK